MWGATVLLCDVWLGHRISIHAPCVGGDLHELDTLHHASIFQSTLPVWGATTPPFSHSSYAVFQSTLPLWGATTLEVRTCCRVEISIHAPRVGSDHVKVPAAPAGFISIHAPRGGSDILRVMVRCLIKDFNPRSPCGERHLSETLHQHHQDFNPRSPCGERRTAIMFAAMF